jgi:hypothetical protein
MGIQVLKRFVAVAFVAMSGIALLPVLAATAEAVPLVAKAPVHNTGSADVGPGSTAISPEVAARMGDKFAALSNAQARISSGGGVQPNSCGSNGCSNTGTAPVPSPLYYEGQGNGGATYTCGPSATRNMVAGMTGTDYGEATFATWESTSSSTGTVISNISGALNTHFSTWGGWALHAPTSGSDLLSYVVTDVNATHPQASIQNVQTSYLPFWNGYSAKHYDIAYGYNISSQLVTIGEEWNHVSNGVNPFGSHTISASTDYSAVHGSPSGQMVW